MFALFPLHPGDDVQYSVSTSSDLSYGRIRSVSGSTASITRYELYELPSPPPPFSCLPLEELFLTSNTTEINLADIQDIVFILSSEDVQNLIISASGIDNIFYIRFESRGDAFTPLSTNWVSFNRYSIPSLIYESILRMQETIVRLINISRISLDTTASDNLYIPMVAFDYT
jgi:hypothetical protein